MAWSRVQSTLATAGSGNISLGLTGVVVGDLLIATAANFSSVLTGGFSDGVNTWHYLGRGNNPYVELWYAVANTGGSLTITATGASSGFATVTEFSPGAGNTFLISDGIPIGSAAGATTASINQPTTVQNAVNDLIVAGWAGGSGLTNWSNSGNYSLDGSVGYSAGSHIAGALYYYLNAAAAPQTPTAVWVGSTSVNGVAASFSAIPVAAGASADLSRVFSGW